jgi:GntR family transcriptional regulator, carbon starvation induced regulator
MSDRRLSRATLAEQVEDAIRFDIIEGVLLPGQRLRAGDLADQYDVSATPLREALQRLAAENLVVLDPRVGATVADISIADLRDVYKLRDLLEGVALERSVELGEDAWASQIRTAWEAFRQESGRRGGHSREDAAVWSAAHRRLHEALTASCDSPWLLRFVGMLNHHSERYRMLSARAPRPSLAEHEAIVRHATNHRGKEAVEALVKHRAGTIEVLEQSMAGHASLSKSDPDAASPGGKRKKRATSTEDGDPTRRKMLSPAGTR